MKEKTKAYMAGLTDAEGCFDIEKHYQTKPPHNDCFYPALSVTNENQKVLKYLVSQFGGTSSFKGYSRVGTPLYRWRTQGGQHLSWVIDHIFPHLVIKKQDSLVIRDFLNLGNKHNPEKRRELYDQIKFLHHNRSVETDTLEFENRKPNLIHAYHAGLIDGENTISIGCYPNSKGNPNFKTVVIFTNTFKPVVDQFLRYGGGIKPTPAHGNRVDKYDWQICDKKGQENFLLKVLPYLIIKRESALIFLEYLRIDGPNPTKRRELMVKIKAFQRKGPNSNKIQPELADDRESVPARMQDSITQ